MRTKTTLAITDTPTQYLIRLTCVLVMPIRLRIGYSCNLMGYMILQYPALMYKATHKEHACHTSPSPDHFQALAPLSLTSSAQSLSSSSASYQSFLSELSRSRGMGSGVGGRGSLSRQWWAATSEGSDVELEAAGQSWLKSNTTLGELGGRWWLVDDRLLHTV